MFRVPGDESLTDPPRALDWRQVRIYPDDVAFDAHDPDTSFLVSQMARACVLVQPARPQYDARDNLEFYHNVPMVESVLYTQQVRDVVSEDDF